MSFPKLGQLYQIIQNNSIQDSQALLSDHSIHQNWHNCQLCVREAADALYVHKGHSSGIYGHRLPQEASLETQESYAQSTGQATESTRLKKRVTHQEREATPKPAVAVKVMPCTLCCRIRPGYASGCALACSILHSAMLWWWIYYSFIECQVQLVSSNLHCGSSTAETGFQQAKYVLISNIISGRVAHQNQPHRSKCPTPIFEATVTLFILYNISES